MRHEFLGMLLRHIHTRYETLLCHFVTLLSSQGLVGEVETTKNVVEATNRPKLYERLEHLQSELSICEKALAEYLETKRLAFPRFYFVSSADLLDILSQGNNPVVVG